MQPNETRDASGNTSPDRSLPPAQDGLSRFLGGSPLAVFGRLVLLSVLVGVVLAAIGFDPWNIVQHPAPVPVGL